MRIRAILALVGLLLVACLCPAATPNTQVPPVSGPGRTVLKGHTDIVNSVAWSPDGTRLASGSRDKTIIVWNVASGKPQTTLNGHTNLVVSVAWKIGGARLS